jgi:predicted SprT family Zn-dependent metalloprotease
MLAEMPGSSVDDALLRKCEREIPKWLETWRCPELADRLVVSVSTRMRTTLGRCSPRAGQIQIAAFLLDAPEALLREVLCHEVAHAAVSDVHRQRLKPHGPEWKELMRAAGYRPRARLPRELLESVPGWRPRRVVWEHRCPVCHATRRAGRPVKEWRCGACWNIWRRGRLEVTRVELRGN